MNDKDGCCGCGGPLGDNGGCEACMKDNPDEVAGREWLNHSLDCCCGDRDCPGSHPEIFPKRD